MLQIFNTLGREQQEFKPLVENKVSFYQCGPTVYSHQHIGNLFSAVKGDLIRRSLTYLGYEVEYVMNVTDVGHLTGDNEGDADSGEDKMAKGSRKEGLGPERIAEKYWKIYEADLEKLNVLKPDQLTIATEYVEKMADMVQELIDRGYAYATEKAIYFDVSKFENYTQLSGQKLEMNLEHAGHGDVYDTEKKNSYDFAVWFFKCGKHENAIQTWERKFEGIEQAIIEGFPGWHIECSAMSRDTLGETIDIHMGGREHIPVHHTNEIAQSEAANGKKFVNYWLHHEMLDIGGGKMSKSVGNVYTLDDLIEKGFDPIDYRYFLLGAHYRSRQNFTWEALEGAKTARGRLVNLVQELVESVGAEAKDTSIVGATPASRLQKNDWQKKFTSALEDDFNIPMALGITWDMLKSDISDEEKLVSVLDFDRVFGLELDVALTLRQAQSDTTLSEQLNPQIEKLIEEREQARAEKNWEKADEIRDRLKSEFGYEVHDEKA